MSNNNGSTGTVLLAFALGALAGATVALLYAPAKGDDTRRRLREKVREGREKAQDLASQLGDVVDQGREAFDRARREAL